MLVVAHLFTAITAVAALQGPQDQGGACTINLQHDLDPAKEPLILEINETRDHREQLDFIWPDVITNEVDGKKRNEGEIHVDDGKKLLFSCTPGPGKKVNSLRITEGETGTAVCSGGQLTINGKPLTKDTMSCSAEFCGSWVEKTEEKCGKGDKVGYKFLLGFKVKDDSGKGTVLPLAEVCHNIEKMESYYTAHQVLGRSIKGKIDDNHRKPFSPDPKGVVFLGANIESLYTKNNQMKVFDKILGPNSVQKYLDLVEIKQKEKKGKGKTDESDGESEKEDEGKKSKKGKGKKDESDDESEKEEKKQYDIKTFLSRGHLAPDADFIYNSGQQMTYYHINIAPQWQNFNAGIWLTIETAVRAFAGKVENTLNVWTGTYGVLKLEDDSGKLKEIYLDPLEVREAKSEEKGNNGGKLRRSRSRKPNVEIPKIDRLPVPELYWKVVQFESKCVAIVGVNNVKLRNPPTPICKAKEKSGWPDNRGDLTKGYVYYCDYNDFKKVVNYVPDIECKEFLKF